MRRRGSASWAAMWCGAWLAWACPAGTWAGAIAVPNASFELPATDYVSTLIDDWQKSPKPEWYEEGNGFYWHQLTGVFRNPAPSSSSHKDNCHGDQALWLFAVPEAGLFQELGDPAMASESDVRFEAGKGYRLTVGLTGGGGRMLEGVTLELGLYYRDDASNQIAVATTTVTNSRTLFPVLTHFVDFSLELPAVEPGDAWAGRPIGVRLLSTVDPALQGGYWDVDNVRLDSISRPAFVEVGSTNGVFQFTLESEPGLRFELLANADPSGSSSPWSVLTSFTNLDGRWLYAEPATNAAGRLFRARQLD